MPYSFSAYGHPNITAKHKTTLEFTKDKEVTKRGDCIIGTRADFDLESIKKFIRNKEKIKIIVKVGALSEEISAEINKDFNDNKEIVIRRSDFACGRTLGIKADKACIDLNKELIEIMKNPNQKLQVFLS
ncbi:DUF371 domain-containing protein [Candidatus Woesearchaeota archaeon]|nr:DUF371 domain-containing protein [Candidatus Woesearchaeota archaeon]